MHSFKRVVLSLVTIFLLIVFSSAIIIVPYQNSEEGYFQDHTVRRQLAGTLDTLMIGASNGLEAWDTRVVDREMGCSSYNLSAGLMTLNSRYFFLDKELRRNPVKTVVIELSYETLVRNEHGEYAEGDETALGRLDSVGERMQYMLQCVDFDDWLNLYSRQFVLGLNHGVRLITGKYVPAVDYSLKGFRPMPANDLTLTPESAAENYKSYEMDMNFREENIEKLEQLVALCREYNTRIVLITVPYPDAAMWTNNGHDRFHSWVKEFSEEQDCEYYDFNLLKNRYALFSDSHSYYDIQHMSAEGAAVFTEAFCDVLKNAEKGDVSAYFYDSYEQMKADSPYIQYLN